MVAALARGGVVNALGGPFRGGEAPTLELPPARLGGVVTLAHAALFGEAATASAVTVCVVDPGEESDARSCKELLQVVHNPTEVFVPTRERSCCSNSA